MTGIPLIGAIAEGSKLAGIGRWLKSVPSWVWIALATAFLLAAGYTWHQHRAKRMLDHAYSQGKVDGAKQWIAKTLELAAALERQTAAVNALAATTKAQQAASAAATKRAEPIARQAESVAERLDRSAKALPAKPCEPSKALAEAWR